MNKHTPGPWAVNGASHDALNITHSDARAGAASGILARVTHRVCWAEEQSANAHLIAAAPELLEALRDVHALACKVMIANGTDAEFADIRLEKATAAIAKATGAA